MILIPRIVNDAGRGIFVVDAHRDDGKRDVVRSDEKLTAFLETEKITRNADHHWRNAHDH